MQVLIATDVYGVGPHIDELIHRALPKGVDAIVIDPYGAVAMNFDSEQEAYEAFTESGGMEVYANVLSLALQELSPTVAIGFSAGGAALWQAGAEANAPDVEAIMAFYPGQVRNMLHLTPQMPTQLILPASEPHFDVDALVTQLANHADVDIERSVYLLHGFMNPLSVNFDESAYEAYLDVIKGWIKGE